MIYGLLFKFNYHFGHELLTTWDEFCTLCRKLQILNVSNLRRYGKITGDPNKKDESKKRRQNGRRKMVENENTEDGVIFKGERM